MTYRSLVWICLVILFGSSSAMPIELIDDMEVYRNACITMSGSDRGFEQMMMSMEPLKACVANVVNFEQLAVDMQNAPDGNWHKAYLSYCPRFNETVPCFDKMLEGLSKCTGEDIELTKNIFRNVFNNVFDIICEEQLRVFAEFNKPEFKTCSSQFQQFGVECELWNASTKALNSFSEEECREFDQTKECVKTKVDQCGAPFIMELFDAIFNPVMQASSCKLYTKPSEVINNDIKVAAESDKKAT